MQLATAAVVLLATWLTGRWLILDTAQAADLILRLDLWPLPWRFLPVFQALNEEILFRVLLLGWLVRRLGRPSLMAILCAASFAVAHLIFYGTAHTYWLSPTAVGTLFLFGLATNVLYLRTGHLWYGYALHLGWNLTRFGGTFFECQGGREVFEGATFTAIEGANVVLVFALAIVLASMLLTQTQAARRRSDGPLRDGGTD